MEMKTVNDYPPNYNAILMRFPMVEEVRPVFAYGDTIYHESVHMEQQGEFPEIWWERYLLDDAFRLEQELEAYGKQYAFVCRNISNCKIQKIALLSMAQALSGEIYGSLLSFSQAESQIKRYAKAFL
jgi:hypothetical protein